MCICIYVYMYICTYMEPTASSRPSSQNLIFNDTPRLVLNPTFAAEKLGFRSLAVADTCVFDRRRRK